jgi:hypothetical protein|tara:strand:- start:485 stop:679 length:195 start_codon:yes stop_codon:yes gene_type:complete
MIIIGFIVWVVLVVLILRFFSVSSDRKKPELTVYQKQLLNIMSGKDQNQDLSESELDIYKNNDK